MLEMMRGAGAGFRHSTMGLASGSRLRRGVGARIV